jgi:hypothetical protein
VSMRLLLAGLFIVWVSVALAGCGVDPVQTCSYAGKTYPVGASFPSTDGCNRCDCDQDGKVFCTVIGCDFGDGGGG